MGGVRPTPSRGEVWEAEFEPVRGREQAGRRPALIVSANTFNQSPSQLVTVVPLTTRNRGYRFHVPLLPPEGGIGSASFVMCEQARVFAIERLLRWRGSVGPATLARIEDRLRILLEL